MAMKPGQSLKLEAVIGFEDCGGSTNSPLGAENWWIERESMEKGKKEEKGKKKGYTGKLGSKITIAIVPRQRHQKCLLVFLNSHRQVCKRTEIPL